MEEKQIIVLRLKRPKQFVYYDNFKSEGDCTLYRYVCVHRADLSHFLGS
jgi:hypothetical protein